MELANVNALVWDLDGTLIDSFEIFGDVLQDVVAKSGHPMPDREERLRNYHGSLDETLKALLNLQTDDEVTAIMDSFLLYQERHYEGDLSKHLYSDAVTLARQAAEQGKQQLIVTNRAHAGRGNASPRVIVASTILAEWITEIRTGDEIAVRKPDRLAVADWMDAHNISPDGLVVIGDQFVDAQLANNIGCRGVIVQREQEANNFEKDGVDMSRISLVKSLAEITLV